MEERNCWAPREVGEGLLNAREERTVNARLHQGREGGDVSWVSPPSPPDPLLPRAPSPLPPPS
jgi:hypothetical protein